jgi:hypothetical protein
MLWPLQSVVHCEYFSLYNVTRLVVPCYGPYSLRYIIFQFALCNMCCGVMLWPLESPVHCEYFSLYNETCLVVSCYGPYSLRYIIFQFAFCNMCCGVMLWPLHCPVHCEDFSLSALSSGISQAWKLDLRQVRLAAFQFFIVSAVTYCSVKSFCNF